MTFRSSSSSYYLKSLPDLSSVYSYPLHGSQRSLISSLGRERCDWSGPCKITIIVALVLLCIWGVAAPLYLLVHHQILWPFVAGDPGGQALAMVSTTSSQSQAHTTTPPMTKPIVFVTAVPSTSSTTRAPSTEPPPTALDCGVGHFLCDKKVCIPDKWLCDGVVDCKDSTDESKVTCASRKQKAVEPARGVALKKMNKKRQRIYVPPRLPTPPPAGPVLWDDTGFVDMAAEQKLRRPTPRAPPPHKPRHFRPVKPQRRPTTTTELPPPDDVDIYIDMNGSNSGLLGSGKIKENVIRKQKSRTEFFG